MNRRITTTGKSRALVLSKDLLEHLGIRSDDKTVSVVLLSDGVLLTRSNPCEGAHIEEIDTGPDETLDVVARLDFELRSMQRLVSKLLRSGVRRKDRPPVEIGESISIGEFTKEHDHK